MIWQCTFPGYRHDIPVGAEETLVDNPTISSLVATFKETIRSPLALSLSGTVKLQASLFLTRAEIILFQKIQVESTREFGIFLECIN